jgi:hypothetical protein
MSNRSDPPESAAAPSSAADSAVERLQRWEDFGGTWRVVARTAQGVTISMCRCDGGEEADRFVSADRDLLQLVAGRVSTDCSDG